MPTLDLALAPAQLVPVDSIARDPQQPRRSITPEDLADLVLSVRAHGVIHPVLLTAHPAGARSETPYMLVCGERRWAAARSAGLHRIPAVLLDGSLTPAARLMLQLEENDGELRRELPLVDRVEAVLRAFKLSGLRKEEFAAAHGKTPSWLSRYLALATADGTTRAALEEGHLTNLVAARLFIRLRTEDRLALLERARRNRLPITDRLIEAIAQRHEVETPAETHPSPTHPASPNPAASPCDSGTCRDVPSAGCDDPQAPLAAAPHPPSDASRITVAISLRQLATLLVLLGEVPGPTPEEQVRQLQKFLD